MSVHVLADGRFLPRHARVKHGFFGCGGGVSAGLYTSLNCGLGTADDPGNVRENRARVAGALGVAPEQLVSLKQTHSALCHFVDRPWAAESRPDGDAMVTDRPGLALGILTADCGPILFYGEKTDGAPVIGAAHAGWGGALRGILESTIAAMRERGVAPDRLCASIGPCIARASYEVEAEFIAPFLNEDPASEHFFTSARREGHLMFDLPGYIAWRLGRAGVGYVSVTGVDTFDPKNGYFSYRRATHRKEADYGRQISALVIQP